MQEKNVITDLVEINPTVSVAALNTNGLNGWIKNKDCQNGFKKVDKTLFLSKTVLLKYKDTK